MLVWTGAEGGTGQAEGFGRVARRRRLRATRATTDDRGCMTRRLS